MDIPRKLVDRYNGLVAGVAGKGSAVLGAQLAAQGNAGYTALRGSVSTALAAADAAVSEVDRQFYRAARWIATGDAGSFDLAGGAGYSQEDLDRALQRMLLDSGDYDPSSGEYEIADGARFDADMAQLFSRMVNSSSKSLMIGYGGMDPLKPRFARVPSGFETCAWCWSLAGLGFQYMSAESASHSHAHCDCAIVPSWGGSGVEGYDSEYYADIFRQARTDLRDGNVSDGLLERIAAEKAAKGKAYTAGWNDVLAVMREKHGLK